ncbi:Phosphoribosylamine--glycine ligase [bioreactor metagenome]|uniref:Glycinamide ribonucleotide synthetase n=1 Tax=bioreactor metagenome TaxID=1076179 RepID=A0A645JCA4_9ZZZZ
MRFGKGSACCVILASEGYPQHYETGFPITLPDPLPGNVQILVAGARKKDGETVTSGGRVLGVTAVAETLEEAITGAYAAADTVKFQNAYFRRDIGQRALEAKKGV